MPARSGLAVLDYPTAGQVFCEENRLERGRNRRYVGGKGICTGEARGGTSEPRDDRDWYRMLRVAAGCGLRKTIPKML